MNLSTSGKKKVKVWLWWHGVERLAAARLYVYGHWMHWRERNQWLDERGRLELLQRALATLSLIIGLIMMFTRHGNAGSQLVATLDAQMAPLNHWLDPRLISLHLDFLAALVPHQVFGAILTISSVSMIVAVYEWPMEAERGRVGDPAYAENRLRNLLRMHLFGHFIALAYWGGSGCLTFVHHPFWIPAWFSFALARIHYSLYLRNNGEYVKECYAGKKARADRERQAAKLVAEKHRAGRREIATGHS